MTVTHFGGAAAAFGKRFVVAAAPAVIALTVVTAVALTAAPNRACYLASAVTVMSPF